MWIRRRFAEGYSATIAQFKPGAIYFSWCHSKEAYDRAVSFEFSKPSSCTFAEATFNSPTNAGSNIEAFSQFSYVLMFFFGFLKVDFIDVGQKDKVSMLVSHISMIQPDYERLIVFCNTTESCRAIEHGLRDSGLHSTTSMHGAILPKTRAANYEAFLNGSKPILVATDISCRGIDFPASTGVVIFDFPSDISDFLHRAGRTARAGKKGVVYALVTNKDRQLVDKIRHSMKSGMPIDLKPIARLRVDSAFQSKRKISSKSPSSQRLQSVKH